MANNAEKQPLLSGTMDASNHIKKRTNIKRYRRSKSAPLTDLIPEEKPRGSLSSPVPESILQNVHPNLRRVVIFLAMYLGIGTLCFYLVRHQIEGHKTNGILDAIYFCIVTMTTVGYGDLVPSSVASKLLACAFVFSGMALVGMILSSAADYLVEKQELLFVKALNIRHQVGTAHIIKEMKANRVKYKFIIVTIVLATLIIIGTLFLSEVEKLDFVDSFYCVCSTITTLGYGDKSFSTGWGRIFAIFWILASTICLAQFFFYLAEMNTEQRRQSLAKWVLTRRMTCSDLEAADFDNDGVVSAAEFIVFKLKEMGKISEDDIESVMEEFEELDVDQSGTISVSDLTLAQASQ